MILYICDRCGENENEKAVAAKLPLGWGTVLRLKKPYHYCLTCLVIEVEAAEEANDRTE